MKAFHIVCTVNICGRGRHDGDSLFGCSKATLADFTPRGAAVLKLPIRHLQNTLKKKFDVGGRLLRVQLLHDDARPHIALLDTC